MAGFVVVLLFPLFPAPRPASLSGHPWKVELIVFLILSALFALLAIKRTSQSIAPDIGYVRNAIAVFVFWSAASVFWAGSSWSVFHHTAVWTAYLFVFGLTAWLLTARNGIRAVLGAIVCLGTVLGLLTILGYLQVIANPRFQSEFRVIYSKYSEVLVILGPFFFVVGAAAKRRAVNLYSAAASIAFAAIVFSLSRASFVSVLAGYAAAIALLVIFLRNKPTLKRAGAMLALFSAIFVGAQFLNAAAVEITLIDRFSSENSYQTSSSDIRRLLIGVSSEMIRQNPIIGVGADNYGLEINNYRAKYAQRSPGEASLSAGEEMMLERAHNEYLQIFSELGLIGVIIFAGILVSAGLLFKKRITGTGRNPETAIRIGAVAGSVGFLVSSLFSSFSFRAIQTGVLFFVIVAVAVCPFRIQTGDITGKRATLVPKLLFSIFAAILFGSQAVSMIYVLKAENSKQLPVAVDAYSKAAAFDSTSAAIDWSLANRYFIDKDPKTAALYYEEAIRKGGGVITAYHYLAVSRRMSGDVSGAERAMRECTAIYPRSVYAKVFLADLLRSKGRTEEADVELKEAFSIDMRSAGTWKRIFENGTLKTSVEARGNKELIPLAELNPNGVVLAILAVDKLYESDGKESK